MVFKIPINFGTIHSKCVLLMTQLNGQKVNTRDKFNSVALNQGWRKWTSLCWTMHSKNSSIVKLHTQWCIKASKHSHYELKQYELDKNLRHNEPTYLRLRSAKSSSYLILFCLYLFCFRAPGNSSDNTFNRLQMCAAPAAAAALAVCFPSIQPSLSSSSPFHSIFSHCHFHLDVNSRFDFVDVVCINK